MNLKKQIKFTHILLIIFIGAIIYSNTLHAPFRLDSGNYITGNQSLLENVAKIFDAREVFTTSSVSDTFKTGIITRRVSFLSFALNYWLHGFDVLGYHLLNILIHLFNAVQVYICFLLLVSLNSYMQDKQSFSLSNNTRAQFGGVALFASLLFVAHPIQTQAVTYIVQRFASLATLFYLSSLIFYLVSVTRKKVSETVCLYILSVCSASLAMLSKEISFTLPAIIVLAEAIFLRGALLSRVKRTVPFFLLTLIIPYNLFKAKSLISSAGDISDSMTSLAGNPFLSNYEYLLTQFRVIVTYLRLLFVPAGQRLNYDYPEYHTFFSAPVLLSCCLLMMIVFSGLYFLFRSTKVPETTARFYRTAAFGIFWFFVTLSVESSFIPIESVIYEHRLYLPSIGFFIAIVSIGMVLIGNVSRHSKKITIIKALSICVVLAFSWGTYERNKVWRGNISFWEDNAAKSPNHSRTHLSLSLAYFDKGRMEDAEGAVRKALRLDPASPRAYYQMGRVLAQKGEPFGAVDYFKKSLKLYPGNWEGWFSLALAYEDMKQYENAIESYMQALNIRKNDLIIYVNLGKLYQLMGEKQRAVDSYIHAISINKFSVEANFNLGLVYAEMGKYREAVSQYLATLQIDKTFSPAYGSLGVAYYKLGNPEQALESLRKALQYNPSNKNARENLQKIQSIIGQKY